MSNGRPAGRRFAAAARDHQLQWALNGGVPAGALREHEGKHSWVLKHTLRKHNLFRSRWWEHIAGFEHRWASALNSSQCFGVNLFAPLHEDPARARSVLRLLLPHRDIDPEDTVSVLFEHTPDGAAEWLGERGQPTQVDVFFEIRRAGQPGGFVLVEVKFTESGFGSCRGWNGKRGDAWVNPNREHCRDIAGLVRLPSSRCWLAKVEGRSYWALLSRDSSTLRLERIALESACPFRHGLYQLMRNRILADELCARTQGAWAELAVCRHPGNMALMKLKEAVAGNSDALAAFSSLSTSESVRDWNAEEVLDMVTASDGSLKDWHAWMRSRYFS